jgi:CO/xanthine dehydrogenase Mo-binding subunit
MTAAHSSPSPSQPALSRRDLLKGGALVVGFTAAGPLAGPLLNAVAPPAAAATPDPALIDSWIAVHADNTATVLIGKVELGQGATTGLLQIAAEELDLAMRQVSIARIDTDVTPNQGATAGSWTIQNNGPQVRAATAEARQALLQLASAKLNAPADRLQVRDGVVTVDGDPGRAVSYGDLLGDRRFNVKMTGKAPQKPVSEYRLVTTRVPRVDVPDKVSGRQVYMQHVRLPGMLHGRIVRPRGQGAYGDGARVKAIDEGSIADIAGARVVRRGDFVGVVAEREWDAVRAADRLRILWDVPPRLPAGRLFDAMRASKTADSAIAEAGDVPAGLAKAVHVAGATYYGPYQGHAPFAPSCALADAGADRALVICSTLFPHGVRTMLSQTLGLPADQVQVQYYESSGVYGRACADDCAIAAAVMSQLAGRPVRVQFMRWDELGWDNYAPPHLADVRAGVDADGNIVAYEYHGWNLGWNTSETSQELATGAPVQPPPSGGARLVNKLSLTGVYDLPNVRLINHHVPGLDGYLKGGHLRSPVDLSIAFASEQTIDELAHAVRMDPVAFRHRNMSNRRWLGVLDAAVEAAGWSPRVAHASPADGRIVTGRGVGLGTHLASHGAAVADIEVDRDSGKIQVVHLYGAIDCGLVINPALVENQIEGMLVQAASRALIKEVQFSATNVTSLDWNSYPVMRFADHPGVTPVVVQRLDERSTGAGEEVMAAAVGAIANAFFDATGKRLREYPMTPERVRAVLKA